MENKESKVIIGLLASIFVAVLLLPPALFYEETFWCEYGFWYDKSFCRSMFEAEKVQGQESNQMILTETEGIELGLNQNDIIIKNQERMIELLEDIYDINS